MAINKSNIIKIIDASVALKWFIEEEGSDRAQKIFSELIRNPKNFAVPELFFFEVANIFNRAFKTPTKDQLQIFETLTVCGINRFSFSNSLFIELRFFQDQGLSGYDASYAALAKILKGVWITADSKAHRKIERWKCSELL
jgi:predicted nucleic acid-binding protein